MLDENSVFISYAHQDTTANRVAAFTQFLHDCLPSKIELLLDRKYLGIGKNIPNYIQRLEICPVAIILMTPEYKRRSENATGAVFSEFDVIRRRMLDDADDFLCLPVLFEGTSSTSIPATLAQEMYENFTGFHPRLVSASVKRYYLSDKLREEFIPKFTEIARAVESKITVRSFLPQEKYEQLLERLFAKTKITRDWIKLHPEFYNHLFVSTRSYKRVKKQNAVFLIGRKGSGKSTVANTLPQLEHERYKTCIAILADHINLLSTFEFIDHNKIDKFFNSISQRLGNHVNEYTKFNPTQHLFKYAWLGLLYICLAKELCELGRNGKLNTAQNKYFEPLSREYKKFTFSQSKNIETSRYFTLASVAFSEFWDKTVTEALNLGDFTEVVRYIDSNVNEENYLRYLLSDALLAVIRDIVYHCDRYALITLDDFDSVFSMFRKSIRKADKEDPSENSSKSLETAWVQSLMILILELKGYRKGWRDKIFDKIDFCITIPRDSYAQVLYEDRDAFLNIECTADLDWTGVYLAQMLLKRLCYIYDEDINENKDVFSELNRVIRTFTKKLPATLRFDFNGERISINLFCYVLRHTFWRPRDILTYYAALMTAAMSCPDQERLSVEQIRRIVGVTTKNILRTEFIGEFEEVISNLDKIINQFRKSPQSLDYEQLFQKLKELDFSVMPQGLVSEFHEKLRILYEIGFLGLLLSPSVAEEEKALTNECFYFNEGLTIFDSMAKYSFEDCEFLIHPIFVEELRINHKDNPFILNWTDEYLRNNHVVRLSVLDAF